jgi:hypothetical protein
MDQRPETLKVLQENIGETLIDNYFLDRTPIVQEIRARIDKRGCIKFKSFCIPKETLTKMKRQPTEREKDFANYVFFFLKKKIVTSLLLYYPWIIIRFYITQV